MLRNRRPLRPLRTFDILEDRTVPATYQWTGTGANANWNNAANWTLISGTGTFPNAVGDVAQFTGAYTADQKATITTAITVGEIDFGGSGYTGNFGVTITKTAGSLTLTNSAGTAILNVLPSTEHNRPDDHVHLARVLASSRRRGGSSSTRTRAN